MEISDRNAPLISVLATVGVCLSVFPIRAVADDRLSAVSTLAATLTEKSPTAQRRVLHEIFAEEHIAEEALGVLLHADRLPPEQRFEYLSQWVLPSADRPTIRTSLAFTPTDPGPYHPPWLLKSDSAKPNRSGQMMAPILELIDVALELDQLDTIRAQIADAPLAVHSDGGVSNNVESSRRCALALIDAAAGRFTEAAASMEQVLQQTRSRAAAGDFHPDDALLLLLSRTWLVPELREVTAALLSCCDQWMKSPYEPTVRHRHVMAMAYQIHTQDSAQIQGSGVTDDSPVAGQWHPVSRGQDSVRGPGMPNVRWALRPGQSELVSPMNRDYLYFAIPLQGNFEVECDVSVAAWSISSVMIGGRWLGPIYAQNGFDLGSFRWQAPRTSIATPLTRARHWLHYRATVRDRQITTYFNGEPIQTRTTAKEIDPWIAIRSNVRDHGIVRDIRISGTPEIPDSISLSADSSLSVWYPYFGESIGDEGDHWVVRNQVLYGLHDGIAAPHQNSSEARSKVISEDVGSDERVLRYHRPMLEDGTIQYEFFYEPGRTLVHPALDRLAFLLYPSGVQIHQITDGAYEQTSLSPMNVFDEPQHRRGPAPLPMINNDWNQLSLTVTNDNVTLRLNGVMIYERPLESGNQRTFGLFHFSDQTEVRVRNIVWKGNWPRKLPETHQQELAIQYDGFSEDDEARLQATFHHDFQVAGLPADRFKVMRGTAGTDIVARPDGLLASRMGIGGYQNAAIAPSIVVKGDFDVIAEYDQFETSPDATSHTQIALITLLNNETKDEFFTARKQILKPGAAPEQVVQCATVRQFPDGERRHYFGMEPMHERSGRLRMSRRGTTMYYLTAEHDSPHFRLRGQQPAATDDVAIDGVRLMAQIHGNGGHVRVFWKTLDVRAEALSGPAADE